MKGGIFTWRAVEVERPSVSHHAASRLWQREALRPSCAGAMISQVFGDLVIIVEVLQGLDYVANGFIVRPLPEKKCLRHLLSEAFARPNPPQ